MSDLTEILKMQWDAYPNALKTGQEAQASAIALQNARRAQQERMDLKALYAQQPNPSFQAVGAIDPAFAIVQQQAQMQLYKDQIENKNKETQTEQINFKMGKEQQDLMAKLAAATIDEYDRNIEAKMPQAQALDIYNRSSSRHLSENKQRGIIPPEYPSFDPESMNPEALRIVVKGQGFPTEKDIRRREYEKTVTEQQANVDVGPVMTPKQKLGSVEYDPTTGLSYIIPPLKGNQPPVGAKLTGNEGAGYTPEQNAQFNVLQELLDANPNDETLRRSVIAQRQRIELQGGEQPLMPQSEIVTPTQLQTKRVEQKANEEAAITIAKQQAEEQQAINKSLKAYETLPDINHIRDLIKGSIGSDIEYWTNRLGRTVGESLKAGDFQAALAVVASDMASSVAFAPGSQSDKELAQKLKQVGNLDANMTQDEKMSAVEEWFQGRQRYIGKYGKYSDDELIALGREGKITHETALKVRANRNKGQ